MSASSSASCIPFNPLRAAAQRPGSALRQPSRQESPTAGRASTRNVLRDCLRAMIGSPRVRNTPLIATERMPARPVGGLCETDIPRMDHDRKGGRASALSRPQKCGGVSAFTRDGLVVWLRAHFPRNTCQHVEADTGIPAATVDNWLIGRSQPKVEHFVRLICAYGPALLLDSVQNSAEWIERAAAAERALEIDREMARLRQELEALKRGQP